MKITYSMKELMNLAAADARNRKLIPPPEEMKGKVLNITLSVNLGLTTLDSYEVILQVEDDKETK